MPNTGIGSDASPDRQAIKVMHLERRRRLTWPSTPLAVDHMHYRHVFKCVIVVGHGQVAVNVLMQVRRCDAVFMAILILILILILTVVVCVLGSITLAYVLT